MIGNKLFKKGQPVLYIDTAKTSTIEGAATTVYATGGKGNTRLIAWEGEKTLTFTVEDALLSPIGFSVLSGAGLFSDALKANQKTVHVHMTSMTNVNTDNSIDLSGALAENEAVDGTAPIFIALVESDGSLTGEIIAPTSEDGFTVTNNKITGFTAGENAGHMVLVDYYITKAEAAVSEMQIDAEHFAGYYYVEASTLFRRQSDGVDLPAEITLPNVKIQSNFTFTMASSGDPSTFTFTMDAFPGYTFFDNNKKVLCVMQIIEDQGAKAARIGGSVMHHLADDGSERDLSVVG